MRDFIAWMAVWLLVVVAIPAAQAQTLQVLHTFTGGGDGGHPASSLIFDARGNLYSTAIYGGNTGGPCQPSGCGTVFKLTRTGSSWIFNPLYAFAGGNDGTKPIDNVVFGPGGLLYGTTYAGGGSNDCGEGCGTVFSLSPPARACQRVFCPWTETILHRFSGGDGENPQAGVTFDAAGNLYGTTFAGGAFDNGTAFELTPTQGGGWTEQVLYQFQSNGSDGQSPVAGLIFDTSGNLYGTTLMGGAYGFGVVFELTPMQGGGWTEQVLHSFGPRGSPDGNSPSASLIFDTAGNLYGTTLLGGTDDQGTVFELTPMQGGGWTEQVLYQFQNNGSDGEAPEASLIFDTAGNLYSTTALGGTFGEGTVFELTPMHGGGWMEHVLRSFGPDDDGTNPYAGLIFDAAGNLYGTAGLGGTLNQGTVFKLTPSGEAQNKNR